MDLLKLIETQKDKCHECYACVRNCPVKAVRVKNGQAEILADRCIHCGNCVKICSQNAKQVKDQLEEVSQLLTGGKKIIVGLAPSFPSFNPEITLNDWIVYLKLLGFSEVYEVAWGAQLIMQAYRELLAEQKDNLYISTACPVIVNYVTKYHPELVNNLAPIVSPMAALARYIAKLKGTDINLVLIGPCHAKKAELEGEPGVKAVLTYSETVELGRKLCGKEINQIDSLNREEFLPSTADSEAVTGEPGKPEGGEQPTASARSIPLAGGLLQGISAEDGSIPADYIKVEGSEKVLELFNALENNEIKPSFIDILFCEGCISGVDLSRNNYFKKEKAVEEYINQNSRDYKQQFNYNWEIINNLNLTTSFQQNKQELPMPDEQQICQILARTNKNCQDEQLNCGACGYKSCREKAIAVYQGLAEVEMCLPYLLAEKRSEIKGIQELNRELDSIINSSFDGILVVNSQGCVERVNQALLKMIGLPRDEICGQLVKDLEEKRIIYPSVSLLSLREKRNITLLQNTHSGNRILVTASPVFTDNTEILRVIVNARDLKELDLINDPQEREKMANYLEQEEDENVRVDTSHIVSSSREMNNIIRLADKIASTDSTILLTGESGVGKEVIARYIHEQASQTNKFVKINCAAIPESLLESELFGYETGAFSGARREGKPGLIEQADNGTLFLDEIGEMPLNMQAKLLQILQERRVTRIGGLDPIEVNFRLIVATNRDLRKMIINKEFREDLYYRLNVVPIDIPPLRKRRDDILPLINYYINGLNNKHNKQIELTRQAEELMLEYDWPGNVRELSNLLERVVVTAENGMIDADFLNKYLEFKEQQSNPQIMINKLMPLADAVEKVERELLKMAGDKGRTTYEMAKLLGVNQSTIVRKLKKYFP